QPGVVSCARTWEADHQLRAVEAAGLDPGEFTYGCDMIESVAEALVEARVGREVLIQALETIAAGQVAGEAAARLAREKAERARLVDQMRGNVMPATEQREALQWYADPANYLPSGVP